MRPDGVIEILSAFEFTHTLQAPKAISYLKICSTVLITSLAKNKLNECIDCQNFMHWTKEVLFNLKKKKIIKKCEKGQCNQNV